MLPDFPRIKLYLQKKFSQEIQRQIRNDPFLSLVKYRESHEGNTFTIKTIDGYEDQGSFKSVSSEFDIPNQELTEKGPEAYFAKIPHIVEKMIRESSKNFTSKMEEITQKTGNVVNANSQPLSPDLIMEALEKVDLDFDDLGKPIFPTLVLSPELYAKIQREIPKWETDPTHNQKMKALIEKKRKEWIDRKNRRKLVD